MTSVRPDENTPVDGTDGASTSTTSHPFEHLKIRSLPGWLLALFALLILVEVILRLSTGATEFSATSLTIGIALFYGTVCVWIWTQSRKHGLSIRALFGRIPAGYPWGRILGLIIAMLALTIGAIVVLSYLWPGFEKWLLESSQSRENPTEPLYAVYAILLAPPVEELLFRGIILQRWARKWSPARAIVISSLIFGVLHFNVVGLVLFSMVLSLLYISSRSLMVPIIAHMTNNSLAVFLAVIGGEGGEPASIGLSDFIIWGIILLISLAVLIRFLVRNWPDRDAVLPYDANAGEVDAGISG
jgi:membrane protease YdiL (CAAX protease family)